MYEQNNKNPQTAKRKTESYIAFIGNCPLQCNVTSYCCYNNYYEDLKIKKYVQDSPNIINNFLFYIKY